MKLRSGPLSMFGMKVADAPRDDCVSNCLTEVELAAKLTAYQGD